MTGVLLQSPYIWLVIPVVVVFGWFAIVLVSRTAMAKRLWSFCRSVLQYCSDLVTPFRNIAAELRRMNELKELELSERLNPKTGESSPVIPITEAPGNDTEVFWGVEPKAHGIAAMRTALQRQWEGEIGEEDDDDDDAA